VSQKTKPPERSRPPAAVPTSTYRLQFNREFTFDHACAMADYCRDLGISHCYASPLFQSAPESMHGYDSCCPDRISLELGGKKSFDAFSARLRELGLGLLLDTVPNHMSTDLSNEWWADVLRRGRDSSFAGFFDINWEPLTPGLKDKVLLPILEDR
jgi:(1->4)-alpha-D-glucan 1-alpha-D-glucosylmutase